MIASILTSLLTFVGIPGRGDAAVAAVHTLFGIILQFCGDPGDHPVSGPSAHQLLHLDGCMFPRWVRHPVP